jgi:hypothetical protein
MPCSAPSLSSSATLSGNAPSRGLGDAWQHEVRIEQRLPLDDAGVYPHCIGGRRQAPPEDCGGPLAFMSQRDHLPIEVDEPLWQLQEDMRAGDLEAIRDRQAEIAVHSKNDSKEIIPGKMRERFRFCFLVLRLHCR